MYQAHGTEVEKTAKSIINLAKSFVLADCPYLAAAVARLDIRFSHSEQWFATDGRALNVNPFELCRRFKLAKTVPEHDYLHSLLHCVFLHPFVPQGVDANLWDLACDISVEGYVLMLCKSSEDEGLDEEFQALTRIDRNLHVPPTAENIYRALLKGMWPRHRKKWPELFARDDHRLWHEACKFQNVLPREGRHDPQIERRQWQRVVQAVVGDVRTNEGRDGYVLSELVIALEKTVRERVDYASFLRRFAEPCELPKPSREEFDYISYTYGLQLFGDLPLIELLEQREERKIREFVIVIDTSGSTQGKLVKRFVDTTFDVLTSESAFFGQVHIRIIQCDDRVRSDEKIANRHDLDAWYSKAAIHGCGGTDFRPAFAYVDKLVDAGEFKNLGGLLYLTDGEGYYPDWAPSYRVAFALGDSRYVYSALKNVPPWAMRIVLDADTGYFYSV